MSRHDKFPESQSDNQAQKIGQQAPEHPPRDPDHAAVLADLDPKLRGLLLGIPAGVFGKGEEQTALLGAPLVL
jgi:hypothetical protein